MLNFGLGRYRGYHSDASTSSEEDVYRRQKRSLAKQRASQQPINFKSALGLGGEMSSGAGSVHKLNKVEVEPLEVDINVSFDDKSA